MFIKFSCIDQYTDSIFPISRMCVIVTNSLYVCFILNLRFELRAQYALRTYVTAFCLYRLKFRSLLLEQATIERIRERQIYKIQVTYRSVALLCSSNMRSQISSSFLRHGHLPIREVNCYRRLFQFVFSSSFSSNLFFRMIARTFGKFPPRNVASG